MKISQLLPLILLLAPLLKAEPILNSWFTSESGRYARIYETNDDIVAQNAVTTWSRGAGTQALPTYAGVHQIAYTDNNVYIRTTNLGFHIMGPWYGETNNLFPNYPANQAVLYRFPRTPIIPTAKQLTGLGAIGYFVDGVAMFDSRDAFSYDNSAGVDDSPAGGVNIVGDGIWNRDAYVNESVTFDNANAHQAGSNHHYHANPPGLRHLLGDSVDYHAPTNTYTENPNGNHSPIIGWARDGVPIYGPYGYSSPLDSASGVRRMISGYQKRDGTNGSTNLASTGRTTRPNWQVRNESLSATLTTAEYGPTVSTAYPLGHYLEDYAFKGDITGFSQYDGTGTFDENIHYDLNEYNVRWCITPEFPTGVWAYFTNISPTGIPVFPYNISRYFYGTPSGNTTMDLPANAEILFEGGPSAVPEIASVSVENTGGDVTLTWTGAEGGHYAVQHSESLTQGSWEVIEEVTSNSEVGSITDSARANNDTRGFYRVAQTGLAAFDDQGFDNIPSFSTTLDTGNNILLIIVDDWGIDASPLYNTSNGATLAQMPRLQTLANSGVTFTNAYAQPVCSPTRATMITGRHPFRHGVLNPTTDNTLSASEVTIPEIFTQQNSPYQLATFGKWHLGSGSTGPMDTGGWINFAGSISGGVPDYTNWQKTTIQNGVLISEDIATATYATTDQIEESITFTSNAGTNPWFIWLAVNAPHTPFHDPEPHVTIPGGYSTDDTSNSALYRKSLEALDHEIGRLLDSIDLTKTNVIVVGDNGTPNQVVQTPFSNGHSKGSLYDGGVHVPMVVAGPDVLISGTSDRYVHVVDLFQTILDLGGVDSTTATSGQTIDSQSLVPILQGNDLRIRNVVAEVKGLNNSDGRTLLTEHHPGYKLISIQDIQDPNDTPTYEMYYLPTDPDEQSPLSLPPSQGDAHYDAYMHLVGQDNLLNAQAVVDQIVYIELNPTPATGPNAVPNNQNATPTAITVDGIDAQLIDRFDQSDTYNRVWIKCSVPGGGITTSSTAVVTFPPAPAQTTDRIFPSVNVFPE